MDDNSNNTTPETEVDDQAAEADLTAAPPEAVHPEDPAGQLQAKLEDLHEQKEDLQARLLRTAADYENYRKRTMREREDFRSETEAILIEDLLPAIDTLKLGLKAAEDHPKAEDITQGFALVLEQFKNILGRRGLVEVIPTGTAFDPKLHESVSQLSSDEIPEGHVAETVRVGYNFKDRLLRPASVVVSTGPAGEIEEPPSTAEG